MHHIWNIPFFFELGSYTTADGGIVRGVLIRFFVGDREAGVLAGGFVFKMIGLPAADLAMYHMAKPVNKEKGIGALVSIDETLVHLLTGLNADQYAAEMTGQIAGG